MLCSVCTTLFTIAKKLFRESASPCAAIIDVRGGITWANVSFKLVYYIVGIFILVRECITLIGAMLFVQEIDLNERHFAIFRAMTSWATCGSRRQEFTPDPDDEHDHDATDDLHVSKYNVH